MIVRIVSCVGLGNEMNVVSEWVVGESVLDVGSFEALERVGTDCADEATRVSPILVAIVVAVAVVVSVVPIEDDSPILICEAEVVEADNNDVIFVDVMNALAVKVAEDCSGVRMDICLISVVEVVNISDIELGCDMATVAVLDHVKAEIVRDCVGVGAEG